MSVKIKISSILALTAIVGVSVVLTVLYQPQTSVPEIAASAPPGLHASMTGIKPGTSVSYKIMAVDGQAVVGSHIAAHDGTLLIPSYSTKGSAPVSYNLVVEGPEKPVNIHLKIDPRSGKTSIEGRGLREFSGVTIETNQEKIETRADWSGLVRELAATGLAPGKKGDEGGLRIALFNNDVMNDANTGSPLIIKVLNTTGGGGPTDAGVNQPTACYGSTCNLTDNRDKLIENYIHGFQMMTAHLSAVMMQQAQIIGTFIDAKAQIKTQRELQALAAQAHKDYHPSDQMCRFGSFVKNIGRAELKAEHDKMALNSILMATYLNRKHGNTGQGYANEMDARLKQFREVYCDPMDNNNGLSGMCEHNGTAAGGTVIGGVDKQRFNKDIDFARTVGQPLTLSTDFTDSTAAATADEEDVVALAKNLYWPRSFNLAQPASALANGSEAYMDSRHLVAMMNVAHNSYANIVSMKGASQPTTTPDNSGPAYMKSLMREFGLTDPDIESMLGANPSYYAQMEVLAKKVYQHPNFYTNLYDKPVNVNRIGVSMDAIALMQDRDEYESALRREMLLSMMVEEALGEDVKALNDTLVDSIKIPE